MRIFVTLVIALAGLGAGLATTSGAASTASPPVVGSTSTSGATAPGASGTGGGTTQPPPRARLRDFLCHRALDPGQRAISTTAVMRPLTGTKRMAIRFVLLRRSASTGPVSVVSAPGLNTWQSPSDATLGQQSGDVWIVHHPVVALTGPAVYRFRVLFRWTGADGHVIGRATRLSSRCLQPELRPDLSADAITITPLPGGDDRYAAVVHNRGATDAGAFQIQLTIGAPQAAPTIFTQSIPGVAAHSQTPVHFRGPACTPGEPLQLTLDPQGVIDDVNPADNTVSATCPAS